MCISVSDQAFDRVILVSCSSFRLDLSPFADRWHSHFITLKLRHNERHGVSNHRRLHCLLNCCFRRRSKKTSKLRVTGYRWIPAQKASNAENVSIWWRHHDFMQSTFCFSDVMKLTCPIVSVSLLVLSGYVWQIDRRCCEFDIDTLSLYQDTATHLKIGCR